MIGKNNLRFSVFKLKLGLKLKATLYDTLKKSDDEH